MFQDIMNCWLQSEPSYLVEVVEVLNEGTVGLSKAANLMHHSHDRCQPDVETSYLGEQQRMTQDQ